MKLIPLVATAILAMVGSISDSHADTKLLWRTPTNGTNIVPNSQGRLVNLAPQIDVSDYDRIRIVAVARRPSNISAPNGFGAPFRIELHIGEGTTDLGLLENGVFALNPTSASGAAPAGTERVTAVIDFPVITTLRVEAVGPTTGSLQTTVDIFIYGQTSPSSTGQ